MRAANDESPQSEALDHAGGDGQDVLGGAGRLAADEVGVCVDAEGVGAEKFLDVAGDGLVGHGHHGGRRLAGHHFAGQVGTGEDTGGVVGHDLGDDLGHAEM